VSLKQDLRDLNTELNSGLDAVAADIQRLEDKIANTPVAEDVSEELASLRQTVERLRGLDLPDPDTAPDQSSGDTGTVVDPTNPAIGGGSGTVATDSPGENQPTPEPETPGTVENPSESESPSAPSDSGSDSENV
jgi:hypothetical protein